MNFTREPIIETIITSKEGCKLVVRNSKGVGQEEYFVDALEVISFGNAFFFRSMERPKSFLVPATDYEVLEVRETRVILKHVAVERSIKIAGGRDGTLKTGRGQEKESKTVEATEATPGAEAKVEKKRERRRPRRRRTREEKTEPAPVESGDETSPEKKDAPPEKKDAPPVKEKAKSAEKVKSSRGKTGKKKGFIASLLAPPPVLISDNIEKYKAQFGIESSKSKDKELLESSDASSEAVTEVSSPEEKDLPEKEGGLISEEELLGERTGEGSMEVFPPPEKDEEDIGPAFPSMWFPPSSQESDEEDSVENPDLVEELQSSVEEELHDSDSDESMDFPKEENEFSEESTEETINTKQAVEPEN